MPVLTPSPAEPLADRVADLTAGPARVLALRAPVPGVVSFRASLALAPDLACDEDLDASLLADVLDKGTRLRDRFAFADALDRRGARLSVYADGLRLGLSGRALADDLPDVLALAAEMLREPALEPDEVAKAVTRAVAGVRRSRTSTGAQSAGALARRLYASDHPGYVHAPDAEEAHLTAATPEALRAFFETHVGSDALTFAVVGDVEPHAVAARVADVFGGWQPHGRAARFAATATPEPPGRTDVPIADRRNLDVRMGHPVGLRRTAPDFLAAHAAVFALGGNFSGHLMQTIRDRDGLTYGISASLENVAVEHDAHVGVGVSLSQESLEMGIAAVRAEVERFVGGGVSKEALAAARTTLAGTHVVQLATTGGLAARLLVNAERGFDVGYLDRYPDEIRALSDAAVNRALQQHVRPDDLHVAVAGTLPG